MSRSIGIAFLLSVACACGPGTPGLDSSQLRPTAASSSTAVIRGLLVAELTRTVEHWVGPRSSQLPTDSVEFRNEGSRVVPGLVYYWAQYAPPHSTHMLFRAVVAERGERREILRDAPDWGVASAGWYSEGPETAARACRELVTVVAMKNPPPLGGRLDDTTALTRFAAFHAPDLYMAQLKRRVTTAPVVSKPTDHPVTRIDLWALDQAGLLPAAHYYRCELPRDSTAIPGYTLVQERGRG